MSTILFKNIDTNKNFYLSYTFTNSENRGHVGIINGEMWVGGLIDDTNKCIRTCSTGILYKKWDGVESCFEISNGGIASIGVAFNMDGNNYVRRVVFKAQNTKENPTIVYRLTRDNN